MRFLRTTALVIALGVTVAACGSGEPAGSVTYHDPSNRSLFTLPSGWHLYEAQDLGALAELPFVHGVGSATLSPLSTVAFDGASSADVKNLTQDLATAEFPLGASTIRSIGTDERDLVSRNLLTQAVLPYKSLGNAQEITKEDFSFGKGYDGVRLLVAYQDATSQAVGVAYLISVTDADDRQMYSIVAGCSQDCYVANQDTIEELVDSWLVNTRG